MLLHCLIFLVKNKSSIVIINYNSARALLIFSKCLADAVQWKYVNNVCILKMLQPSVWGGEWKRETIQFLNGNCVGLGFLCLFCNLSLEKASLSIYLICWKTVVAVFYSKEASLLYLNHKHLQVSVKATTLLLWCFGEFVSLDFLFPEIVSLIAIAFGESIYCITEYLWDRREQIV